MAPGQEYGISYWSIESDSLGDARSRRRQAGRAHDHHHQHAGGRPSATHRQLCGERVFTVDAPSIGPERHEPLLDPARLPHLVVRLRRRARRPAGRAARPPPRHGSGYGLSAKPDQPYTMALQADMAAAFVADAGRRPRLALLTHDMGDTVGGELLARRAEGTWPVEVTRRVVTNGSIYIEQAHLTNGQQLLLGLPDAELPPEHPDRRRLAHPSLRETFSPATPPVPAGLARGPVAGRRRRRSCTTTATPAAAAHPLHRGAAGQRAPLHRRHRDATRRRCTSSGAWTTPSPSPSMVDTLAGGPTRRHRRCGSTVSATTRWSRPRGRFLEAVLPALAG